MMRPALRRHDTKLLVRDHLYLVSFLNQTQTIIYTRLDGMDAGQFKLRFGHICSYEPMDFLLERELMGELDYQKTKLINLERA